MEDRREKYEFKREYCERSVDAVCSTDFVMEERLEYAMTDNQWNGILKMVMVLITTCETKEEAIDAIKVMLRNEDADEVTKKIEAMMARRKTRSGDESYEIK